MAKEKPRAIASADPPRNFTLSQEERMRALAAGPPPFAVRLRKIEDLQEAIVRSMRAYGLDSGALPASIERDVERLNRLIGDHNRYYPIEARLPRDLRTGRLMDWGEPWTPMPPVTIEQLVAAARRSGVDGEPAPVTTMGRS